MRPLLIVASTALALTVPAAAFADHHGGGHAAHKEQEAIAAAVAAPTRTPANLARDKYRHPAETLAFFGVKPGDTVVELWPGGGWYTEILAPLAKAGGGTLYAAAPWERGLNRIKEWQGANADLYGGIKLAEFPNAGTNPKVPDASADVVLLNPPFHLGSSVHTGAATRLFEAAARILRPGGELFTVFNSSLGYRAELTRLIGPTAQLERTPKFTVTRSIRR